MPKSLYIKFHFSIEALLTPYEGVIHLVNVHARTFALLEGNQV